MKFILSSIFALTVFTVLNAEAVGGGIIFYGNAGVYGKEYLFVKSDTKKVVETKEEIKQETSETKETEITHEPISVVFPIFPLTPSSYLQGGNESAAISSHNQRLGGNHPIGKAVRENTRWNADDLTSSLYCSEQRQKLSVAATQCGQLTSFGAQSPPRG